MRRLSGEERARWLLVPLAAVLAGLLLVFFVFFNYSTVEGDSMRPTLLPGDRLLVTKGYDHPRRGDIIVFTMMERGHEIEVVKRVVGVPGDIVETRGDLAWVNGKPEPKGFDIIVGRSGAPTGPTRVAAGSIFVLGDNRPVSLDSRYTGPVGLNSVLGQAVAVFSPVTRVRMLDLRR